MKLADAPEKQFAIPFSAAASLISGGPVTVSACDRPPERNSAARVGPVGESRACHPPIGAQGVDLRLSRMAAIKPPRAKADGFRRDPGAPWMLRLY